MLAHTLTPEVLSNMMGSSSLACWLVVYAPQIWENYQLQSGEGLSVAFIVLWLLGDLTGLAGSVMADLIPSVIILALYYTLCDIVLLIQVYYYRRYGKPLSTTPAPAPSAGVAPTPSNHHRPSISHSITTNERTPLVVSPSSPAAVINAYPSPPQPKPLLPTYLQMPLLVLFVLLAGVLGWFLTDQGDDVSIPEKPGRGDEVELEWKSQLLGWASALLYLGSRIPQIIHNFKTRCAGLSLALFVFTITGNICYSASILLTSTQPRYILANLSWLVGALATVVQDLFVIGQFAVYSYQDRKANEARLFVLDEEEEGEDSI